MDQHRFKIRVEKVYANSYHQNLMLNLPKALKTSKQITNISLRRLNPQTEAFIVKWEDYNGVFLPNDVKDFYLAHDGFLFLWTFNPIPEGSPVQCGIAINGLNNLDAITGYEVSPKAGISMKNGRKALALSVNSRVFELEPLGEENETCVCLVYYNVWLRPTVWLWSKLNGFFFLSKDFTTYFRMCIAHLGIIGWQYTFTTMVLPKWTRRIMRKIAPHLLQSPFDYIIVPECEIEKKMSSKVIEKSVVWKSKKHMEEEEVILNKLNPNVFAAATFTSPSWISQSGGGNGKNGRQIGRANSNLALLNHPLSHVRSASALKKGKPTGKRVHYTKSSNGCYNRKRTSSLKPSGKSRNGKK